MKKMLLSFMILLLAATASIAQCDKKVVFYSDKQEMISPEGNVMDNKTDVLTLEFSKESVTVRIADKDGTLDGTIQEVICEWKEVYKVGKAVYKGAFQKSNSSESTTGSMTVEAKDGQLQITVELARLDGRKIRILVNKYEEK
ncbi:hypothetical protein [Paraflavitalea speifideaquila]|uniref:hypothetical protein n=1 Tax=Paraflavitalea speifideaquila TaxID=3076558 RepID=UPI0028EB5FC5|nr:hypothetical protein [Paraflavitalea speifideiaquila]